MIEWRRRRGEASAFPRLPVFWAAVATANAVVGTCVLLPAALDLGRWLMGGRGRGKETGGRK